MMLTLAHAVFKGLLKLLYFARYKNRGNIPAGGVLICSNHTSLFDPLFLIGARPVGQVPHIMAKKELFKNRLFGAFLRWARVFPVDRGAADIAAIKKSLGLLRAGKKLIIFPEGTRTDGPGLTEAKHGAVVLAVRARVPVLPAHVTVGRKFPFRPIKVIFGEPYMIDFQGAKPTPDDYAREADELMNRVYALGKR